MKIPFERTIAGAYRFAFTNILSVIGTGWFPFLLFAGLVGGLAFLLLPTLSSLWLQDKKTLDQAKLIGHILPLVGAGIVILVAFIVVQAMVNVGLMRKALGQHPAPVFIFFSLGSQVWQLIGSYILATLLIIGASIAMGLGIAAISFGVRQVSQPLQAATTGILIFLALLAYIYSAIRLTFFIPAVVVAENHIGLRRSWHLGGGNFWRIIGISLIVSVPIRLADSTIASTMLQMSMTPGFGMPSGPMTDAQGHQVFTEMLAALRRVGPYYALLQIVYLVLVSGLSVGAVANAYKAVAGQSASETKAAS